jgi:hypothetical protein
VPAVAGPVPRTSVRRGHRSSTQTRCVCDGSTKL